MQYRLVYACINSVTNASTSCKSLVKISPVTSTLIIFSQYYLVAMATPLQKLENEVGLQIHHLHVERFHTVKRLRKSVQ